MRRRYDDYEGFAMHCDNIEGRVLCLLTTVNSTALSCTRSAVAQ